MTKMSNGKWLNSAIVEHMSLDATNKLTSYQREAPETFWQKVCFVNLMSSPFCEVLMKVLIKQCRRVCTVRGDCLTRLTVEMNRLRAEIGWSNRLMSSPFWRMEFSTRTDEMVKKKSIKSIKWTKVDFGIEINLEIKAEVMKANQSNNWTLHVIGVRDGKWTVGCNCAGLTAVTAATAVIHTNHQIHPD